jgi:carbonic anhydrase
MSDGGERTRGDGGPGGDARPRRRLAVLACMDARLDPYALLGLERGDAHIVRNAGGLVTDDARRSLSASQRLLGTEQVVVVMHRDCGMEGRPEEGGFEDVEKALREGLERLRADPSLPHRDRIRGLIYDPADGSLEELAPIRP